MSQPPPARRGRPPATSTAEVSRVALRLFHERGYAETTMQDVADGVGVTRRSLFRYFDSKAAIVWHGEADAQRAVAEAIAALPPDLPWRAGVARAALAALRFPDDDLGALRLRLRLITSVPELRARLDDAGSQAAVELAAHVAARTGADPGDVEPLAVGRAVWSASTTGLTWWAGAPEPAGGPAAAVRRALGALGFTDPPAAPTAP